MTRRMHVDAGEAVHLQRSRETTDLLVASFNKFNDIIQAAAIR